MGTTTTEVALPALPASSANSPLAQLTDGTPAVSAVIPCLNEEQTLGLCIEKAFRGFAELGVQGEVVVADNGSTDGSVEIARRMGARVINERRKGYGAALLRGITEARGEIIVMADADDSLLDRNRAVRAQDPRGLRSSHGESLQGRHHGRSHAQTA